MRTSNKWIFRLVTIAIAFFAAAASVYAEQQKPIHHAFYAMDTSYNRPGLSRQQQLDLIKSLGFDGVSENVEPPLQMVTAREEIEHAGLRLVAVYASAVVSPQGEITVSDDLPPVMKALRGTGAIVWLHISGKGPAFESLQETDAICHTLHTLSDMAKINGLRIAVYPHVGDWTAKFGNAVILAGKVNHESFGVTFNLCHCLATGDEKNIATLLQCAGPKLFTATINGADAGVTGADWNKLIQPLGSGTFDVKTVLDALHQNHFDGPIGFQGYGIKSDARTILEPTMAAWKKLSAAQ